jgi:hypothetical protein
MTKLFRISSVLVFIGVCFSYSAGFAATTLPDAPPTTEDHKLFFDPRENGVEIPSLEIEYELNQKDDF